MQNTDFDLNMHTARLLMSEPFFAGISRRINKRASHGIPTAGVMVNKNTAQFEMLYNPDFFQGLTDPERCAVLMHEFYHIIFKHVTDRAPWITGSETSAKIWNIATDLAINSHINNLPKDALIPGKDHFVDLPPGQCAEWYVPRVEEILKNNAEDGTPTGDPSESSESSSGGGNFEPLDDHSGWGDCPKEVKDVANERLKDIVSNAASEAARSNSWGSVSQSIKKEIMESLKTKIDWRKVLRFFVKSSQRANKTSSIRRIPCSKLCS